MMMIFCTWYKHYIFFQRSLGDFLPRRLFFDDNFLTSQKEPNRAARALLGGQLLVGLSRGQRARIGPVQQWFWTWWLSPKKRVSSHVWDAWVSWFMGQSNWIGPTSEKTSDRENDLLSCFARFETVLAVSTDDNVHALNLSALDLLLGPVRCRPSRMSWRSHFFVTGQLWEPIPGFA